LFLFFFWLLLLLLFSLKVSSLVLALDFTSILLVAVPAFTIALAVTFVQLATLVAGLIYVSLDISSNSWGNATRKAPDPKNPKARKTKMKK
jgi:hypothetical protein